MPKIPINSGCNGCGKSNTNMDLDIKLKILQSKIVPKDLTTFKDIAISAETANNAYIYVDNNGEPTKLLVKSIGEAATYFGGNWIIIDANEKTISVDPEKIATLATLENLEAVEIALRDEDSRLNNLIVDLNVELVGEVSRATEAEATLSAQILDEAERAEYQETELNTKIEAEITRASNKETELAQSIADTVKDVKVNGESVVEDNVANISVPPTWEVGAGEHSIQAKGIVGGATGDYAVAMGKDTLSEGLGSLSEGINTQASGDGAHAEGHQTHAGALGSHAEGGWTATSDINEANYSHVEGLNNGTNNIAEHGEGKYGWSYHTDDHNPSKNSIHFVGIGTAAQDQYRKDAEVIMTNGDKYIIGVGNYDGKNINENTQSIQEVLAFYKAWYDETHEFIKELMEESPKIDVGLVDVMMVA